MSDRLCVVMPVYNEQEAIGPVLEKWANALDGLGVDYAIRPYNDGSKDNSLAVMKAAAEHLPHVEVRDKPNGGHGNTILTGYRDAAADGFDWVFQIDSDDEMGPEKFGELWAKRSDYDFLVGIRDGRVQQLPRKIISFVSRLCVRVFYGKSVWDVNTPYRLMRVSEFKDFYAAIPLTTFAPNVILSGLAARHCLRCYEIRVPQHDRTTGEVSIKKWKLFKAAVRSFMQTIVFSRGKSLSTWLDLFVGGLIGSACLISAAFLCAPRRLVFAILCAVVLTNKSVCRIGRSLAGWIWRHYGWTFCGVMVLGCLLRWLYAVLFPDVIDQSCWWPKMDYIGLWEKAQMCAAGVFPVSKSWMTILAYGGVVKVFGESLKMAFVASSLLNLITALLVFLTVRKWFGRVAGVISAALMFLSPYLIFHSANVATEHCYGLFVWLFLYLISYVIESKSRLGQFVSCAGAAGIAWLATWSRAEGVLLFPVAASCLVLGVTFRRFSWKRCLGFASVLVAVFAVGAAVALHVNATMSGARTFFCSNDNVWPRLFGANLEHHGRINSDDVQMVCRKFKCDEECLASRTSQEMTDYIKAEICHRWKRMGLANAARLIVEKEYGDWCVDLVPFWGKSLPGRLVASALAVPIPGLVSFFALLFFCGQAKKWLRGKDIGKGLCSFGIVIFVLGNIVALAIVESQPRYGYLLCICWQVFAGAGISRMCGQEDAV